MTAFALAAVLLLAASLALLARPFWFRRARGAASRQAVNTAIYRDQLAELERDRESGQLGEADYQQARGELQRRLIEDAAMPEATVAATVPSPKKTLAALAIALPVLAVGLYVWLGAPAALDPQATKRPDAGEIAQMVDTLAARLAQTPDDVEGWSMLARSYKALGRYDEAAQAYSRTGALLDNSADLLADYAEVLALASGNSLAGKPLELVTRALKLEPEHIQGLLLAGAAAMERRDYAAAIAYWERLLKQIPEGSEDAETLNASIAQARQKLAAGKASAATAIGGRLELAAALKGQVQPADVVFILARNPEAGPMPVAALKARVADLPLEFRLDDANAIMAGQALSSAKTVNLEARVAKGGDAAARPGDLFGTLSAVKPGAKGLRLKIDQVVK